MDFHWKSGNTCQAGTQLDTLQVDGEVLVPNGQWNVMLCGVMLCAWEDWPEKRRRVLAREAMSSLTREDMCSLAREDMSSPATEDMSPLAKRRHVFSSQARCVFSCER